MRIEWGFQPMKTEWSSCRRASAGASVRLFCFHHAGGSAAVFRNWSDGLGDLEVHAIQLPGRGSRFREAPRVRLRDLAREVAEGIAPLLQGPYALFGHSFGGLVAFEVARELVRRGEGKPVHLFVSGRRGPRLPEPAPPIHGLGEAALLREVDARYGAIPEAVLREPELLQMLLPALRADLEALETYAYQPEAPLDCPITALGGVDDPWATAPELEAWRHETTADFTLRRFAGGHFYLKAEEPLVLEEILSRLAALATPASEWVL